MMYMRLFVLAVSLIVLAGAQGEHRAFRDDAGPKW